MIQFLMRILPKLLAATVFIEAMEPRVLFALPTLWTTQGPGGGGSYFSANVSGQDLWVASDMSGIYHSGNFGQTWQQTNFHSAVGGISGGTASQVQFTADPNVLYIPNSSQSVARSVDGGNTWSKLAGWGSNGTAYWMATDQTSTTRLLVASATKLFISTNGGTSFATVYTSPSGNLFVAGALFDGTNVYVGTNKGLLVSTNGGTSFALASAQPAAGQFMISFTGAKQGTTTRLMAITSTTNPDPTNSVSPRSYGFSKLYRLDYGGAWIDKTSVVPSGDTPKFVQMARNDTAVVYLAGKDSAAMPQVLKSTNGGDSFSDTFFTRTTDGGGVANKNTYTSYSGDAGDFDWGWGGWPWTFVVSNGDANRVMLANSGFIQVTSDGGATWHQADSNPADENPTGASTPKHKPYRTAGADDTSVHYLTWTSPTNIMANYTDITGWRSTDGGDSWAYPTWNGVADNTVYKTELAPDGKLYGAASNVHDMYQSNYLLDTRTNPMVSSGQSFDQNGRVIVSADQGATWSLIHEFNHPVVWQTMDPNNPNRMYAMVVDGIASADAGAAGGVWVTNNLNLGASSTWTKLANPPRTQGHPYVLRVLNDGTLVATYSGRRFDNGTGEKFTDSSGVFVSNDGGATWLDRSHANMHWYTKEITIDPTDLTQNTWYVGVANGFSGTGNDLGDVYRTTNRGANWTKMGLQQVNGLVSLGVNSITINPATREMYVATETKGLFYTPDVTVANLSWTNFSDVTSFPHAWVERTFINPNNPQDIWVATFGGGIKRGGVGPSALNGAAGPTQVNLAWADNSANEGGFAIDRATNSTFTANLITTTAGVNATSAAITGLSPGTTYYFRVRAVAGAASSANSSTFGITTPAAVSVTASQFGWAVSPNKLSFTFSSDVATSVDSSWLTVKTQPGGATIATTGYNYDASSRIATWMLPSNIADGNYHATLAATGVLSSDANIDFFELVGDANHSGAINSDDFTVLSVNFNKTGMNFSQGDFNGDAKVNALDFNILASRYGMTIPSPAIETAILSVASARQSNLFSDDRIAPDGLMTLLA